MLKKEGKINDAVIENMLSWHNSGFHVHVGSTIWPADQDSLENLAKYIIRACFSQERMVYIPVEDTADGVAKIIYTAKDGNSHKTFDAVDWLAHLAPRIPDKYEHTVRYYGHYSNKSRGMRKKAQMDDQIPTVAPGEMSAKQFRQNWARLIQKIYEVDPLICPKCLGDMHIVAFIDHDLIPHHSDNGAPLDVTLYKDIENNWPNRQIANQVRVPITVAVAIAAGAFNAVLDAQCVSRYFLNSDSNKRIVVFGHTHEARLAYFINSKGQWTIYANSGTWIDNSKLSFTFVAITPQKKNGATTDTVSLYQYIDDDTIEKIDSAAIRR